MLDRTKLRVAYILPLRASGILGVILSWNCSGCGPWKSQLPLMGWKAGNEGKAKMLELSGGAVSVPPLQNISLFRFPQGSPFESMTGNRLPVRMCRKGALICTQGDVVNCLYIVQKGTVLLSRLSAHGHETIIEFIRPGDFFGEVPMLTGNIARFNATALQPTVLLIVRSGEFRTLLEDPEACKALIGVLARRCEDAWTQIEALGGGLLEERLRVILSWLCSKMGVRTVDGIQINVTQSQLAQMVGTTRESLNRQIGVLKSQGIIGIAGGARRASVLVLAPERLLPAAQIA